MIALINLGNSNLQSVVNTLDHLAINHRVTSHPSDLNYADKIILPGVGNFGDGMARLQQLDMINSLQENVIEQQKPLLGICLGMQLLFDSSDEAEGVKGLGFIKGKVARLPSSQSYTIPRIGWEYSEISFDFLGLKKNEIVDFYYLHSFYGCPQDSDIIAIKTENSITAAIHHDNIYGCQFHPEKSHKPGLKILKAFERTK